ncbi:DUF1993 family protein [Sphingomonas sp. MMS24-J13]|uniref:DUF1993 domain-containing protein n=1 Tax=Sphingomonas sp. MMS24-J13 TaxID=3238686 RepID=UPI00384C077D
MAFSLYDAIVPSWLQMLGTVSHLIDKAEAWCTEREVPPATLIEARLADDMLPFAYQVKSTAVHSQGAFEGVFRGTFSPDTTTPPDSFQGLRDRIAAARSAIEALDRAEVEALIGRDMAFVVGDVRRLEFTADQFLLSFSQPSFYFHVTTAYAILRERGVAIGKRDYLGQMRIKG